MAKRKVDGISVAIVILNILIVGVIITLCSLIYLYMSGQLEQTDVSNLGQETQEEAVITTTAITTMTLETTTMETTTTTEISFETTPADEEDTPIEVIEVDSYDESFFVNDLFIGDSITQGWESTYDSLSYANRTSDFFNADSVIQGTGGAFFHESIFDESVDYDPDVAIVAFGANDWGHFSSHEELRKAARAFLDKFAERFAGKKLFGISPIWRGNTEAPRATGYFSEVCDTVKQEILSHGLILIDGETLTPSIPDFYSDKYLHPNGLGFGIYAENLCKILKNYI